MGKQNQPIKAINFTHSHFRWPETSSISHQLPFQGPKLQVQHIFLEA